MKRAFVPDAGDIIWLTFHPQAGREQAGRRPALVLSPKTYNAKSGLALACLLAPTGYFSEKATSMPLGQLHRNIAYTTKDHGAKAMHTASGNLI